MQCDSAFEMLDAYLDGELTVEASAAIREHLNGCTRCSAQIADTARLQRALRGTRGHFTPSAEFRQRIHKQVARSRRRSWVLPWMPVAAAMAAMLVLVFVWVSHRQTSDAIAEIADLHVNALASANQVDIVSTDRHTVKPWFQGRIPFTFNLPEFSGTDFTLVGGRVVYFHQQPGAQLIVSMRQHKISVLIFQESSEMERGFPRSTAVDRRTSFGMETWQSQSLRFVFVSDADPSGIDKLARLFREANR
jgi:anti-sigma factor RsiW